MGLLKKVFITVFIIATLTMVALFAVGFSFARYGVTEATNTQQLELAREMMRSLDRMLYERMGQMYFIGETRALLNAVEQPRTLNNYNAASERLREFAKSTGPWDELTLIDKNGTVIAALDAASVGRPATAVDPKYDYVFRPALNGKTVYSDAFADARTKKPTMLFAAPLRANKTSASEGIVVGHLSWSAVLDILRNDSSKAIGLYDSEGVELGDSIPTHMVEIFQEGAGTHPAIKRAIRNEEGSIVAQGLTTPDKALLSFVPERGYKDYAGNHWILVVETPVNHAFATINRITAAMPPLFIFIIGLAILLFMIMLNRIVVKHVRALMGVAHKIALGDLTQRTHINTDDEFGQLGDAFNRMADKLQELYQRLEARANQRLVQAENRVKQLEAENERLRTGSEDEK